MEFLGWAVVGLFVLLVILMTQREMRELDKHYRDRRDHIKDDYDG